MAQVTTLPAALATPVNAAFATATTGGTLAAATYYYRVSALDGRGGETLASAETSQVTTGATSTVTVNWDAVSGATGYKVYGRTTGAELLIATVGAVTTYTDTGSITPAGALPSANTTGLFSGTSSDIAVAAGASVTVGIYTADANGIPADARIDVYVDSPGNDILQVQLTANDPLQVIAGPCTVRGKKPASAVAYGMFHET